MKDVNSIVLIGRVTHDIGEKDFTYLQSGSAKLKFSIAVNDTKKNGDSYEDEASFFEIEYLGKAAEGIKPYVTKGTLLCVTGKLKQDRWENKDGQKHNRIYVVANFVQLCGSKKGTGETFTPSTEAMPSAKFEPIENPPF